MGIGEIKRLHILRAAKREVAVHKARPKALRPPGGPVVGRAEQIAKAAVHAAPAATRPLQKRKALRAVSIAKLQKLVRGDLKRLVPGNFLKLPLAARTNTPQRHF